MSAFRQSVEAMIPALRRYARALRAMPTSPTIWCRTRWCARCVRKAVSRRRRQELALYDPDQPQQEPAAIAGAAPAIHAAARQQSRRQRHRGGSRDIARALSTLVEEQRAVLLL
jgi:RNA polymerase sigma-70 factor (ECF subfamily)